ncbi:flagellar hook-associated protein FlgK [Paracoccus caeni]|uniref:Flagellar hook-associated protein 1 n=1 Tax=Paracoccus caeni TaxID=657651 RepID=A0A934W124_9RHOB|nr:flagellar hook-associated protein FlgK [Paracoccus caeni]MBK4216374.1 flagellar hook-associated protein FlgK [Paracoccus caeni]
MSMAQAMSNALSGLKAVSRGTETVAANIANAMTPGYARREVSLASQSLGGGSGGVRIIDVTRMVNAGILAESRLSEAAKANAATLADFTNRMQATLGIAGEAGSLGATLTDFQTALISASARPEDELRLSQVALAAVALSKSLNNASAEVQKSRTIADQAIAADIASLNAGLENIASLNQRISLVGAEGSDPSALIDERQRVVDLITRIVPLQQVDRPGGAIALFTKDGAALLDGSRPAELAFAMSGSVTAQADVMSGSLSRLNMNGVELTPRQMQFFSGGTLAAHFTIRDELGPQLQAELDVIAFELHERFADPSVDPSLVPGMPGIFTDAGLLASDTAIKGLAGRLAINDSIAPDANGELWRIRSGLGSASPGAIGDTTLLTSLSNAIGSALASPNPLVFDGVATLSGRFAQLESRVATRRVNVERELAGFSAQAEAFSSRLAADGVDSDAEMQRLLQYEQAYAANARMIQAIDDMMQQLLRL